jgi:hypothetical protein
MKKIFLCCLLVICSLLVSCSSFSVFSLNSNKKIKERRSYRIVDYYYLNGDFFLATVFKSYEHFLANNPDSPEQDEVKKEFEKGNSVIVLNYDYFVPDERDISITHYKVDGRYIFFIVNTYFKIPDIGMDDYFTINWDRITYKTMKFIFSTNNPNITLAAICINNRFRPKSGTSSCYRSYR